MPASSAKGTNARVIMQNALKTLAANIRFASVDTPIKTLVVTSSVPNEGKSFVALELARTLASGGKDVLLVECDMHRRTLAGVLGVHPSTGLYAVLSGQATLEEAVAQTDAKGLSFLDCEPHIPNPADILASRRFHHLMELVRDAYDYVVFDTPPLSAFVDAAVLGSVADGTLLVVRENFVKRDELMASADQLHKADANLIGTVLNFCESQGEEHYYNYYARDDARDVTSGFDAITADSDPVPAPHIAARSAKRPAAHHAEPGSHASGLKPLPKGAHVAARGADGSYQGYRPSGGSYLDE